MEGATNVYNVCEIGYSFVEGLKVENVSMNKTAGLKFLQFWSWNTSTLYKYDWL